MATLLISDLHLPAQPSPLRGAFIRFLQGPAREAEALYILGDLFEVWIGDDIGLQLYAPEIAQMAVLTQRGVRGYFMHGNRDFMVGADFAQVTGFVILKDPLALHLHGVPTLLSHGDLYCTDDVGYQRWRRFSRNGVAQAIFRRLPLALRERVAGNVRGRSAESKRVKTIDIMDVNDGAVQAAFTAHEVPRLIHGHTHRPANHAYLIGGRARERIVIADWRPEQLEYLRVDERGVARVGLS